MIGNMTFEEFKKLSEEEWKEEWEKIKKEFSVDLWDRLMGENDEE